MPHENSNAPGRPTLEALETRELLSATVVVAESFDKAAAGLPSGWSGWSSESQAVSTRTTINPLQGEGALLQTSSNSRGATRAWVNAEVSADAQVSAAIYLDSLIPAQILGRGRNLDTTKPSYYAVSVVRGLEMSLIRVVDGVTTPLGTMRSTSYLSRKWIVVTLETSGNAVRGRVYRADTGEYLNAKGGWQSTATWALEAADSTLAIPGKVGLNRPASFRGGVTYDDFTVCALTNPVETFDSTPVGTLPAGWQQFNQSNGAVAVSTNRALSAPQSLAISASNTKSVARAWQATTPMANTEATVSLFVDSVIPGVVFARGRDLGTATPSYYAVSVSRGLVVQLVRVQAGTRTVLAEARNTAKDYTTGLWIRTTVFVNGNNVRAQIYRTDRSQYLTRTGLWQNTPTWAINLTDDSIQGPGVSGLARDGGTVGTVAFDDFSVITALGDSESPQVAILSPEPSATLKGTIQVQAKASDNHGVVRTEFYVDGELRAVETTPGPYRWDFDTRRVLNGEHTIDVIAYDAWGNVARAAVKITTANDFKVQDPAIPRHLDHVRVAQLAFNGTPLTAYETDLLRTGVDLVVADRSLLEAINALAPNTPLLLYTNISNIYYDTLASWLAYADANGYSRDSAFYHVTKATAFIGDSASSQPVTWFWNVSRGEGTSWKDLTLDALGRNGKPVTFGSLGQSLAIGYPERFREVNVNLATSPGPGWAASLEYVTRVDAAGRPISWAPLNSNFDSTRGFTQSGRMVFDPPSDWVAASINGSLRLFYVRYRTTANGTAPTVTTLLGRDYVEAFGTGRGTIPAFDSSADLDRDGYLNDAEYARRATGKNARFLYESRIFHGNYGQMRFSTNVSNAAFRAWVVAFHSDLLTKAPLADGLFVDNSTGLSPLKQEGVAETLDAYTGDYSSLLHDVGEAVEPRWLMANTSGGNEKTDAVARQTSAVYEEFALRPLASNALQFETLATQVSRRLGLRTPSPFVVIDSLPTNGSPTDPRTQLATLAAYYLLADPEKTMLNFFGGFAPNASWTQHWSEAVRFNVGKPKEALREFARGMDPTTATFSYRVFARSYENSLVLYKPLSSGGGVNGGLGDATATSHILDGVYRPLMADGRLGDPLTSVTLRNGEGAILVRVP